MKELGAAMLLFAGLILGGVFVGLLTMDVSDEKIKGYLVDSIERNEVEIARYERLIAGYKERLIEIESRINQKKQGGDARCR